MHGGSRGFESPQLHQYRPFSTILRLPLWVSVRGKRVVPGSESTRLADTLPEYDVAAPETDEEAVEEIKDADAAMGRIPPDALKVASMVRWLHNPDVGPFVGYYYRELIEQPLTMTNPRGIYFDHITHLVLTFMLALARGLPWHQDAQRRRVWNQEAPKSPYVFLGDSTVLINGLGGIGHELHNVVDKEKWY